MVLKEHHKRLKTVKSMFILFYFIMLRSQDKEPLCPGAYLGFSVRDGNTEDTRPSLWSYLYDPTSFTLVSLWSRYALTFPCRWNRVTPCRVDGEAVPRRTGVGRGLESRRDEWGWRKTKSREITEYAATLKLNVKRLLVTASRETYTHCR